MAALDTVSLTIMFAAILVLAGIMSSLVALRFGAPLLLVFLLVGMLAGESGVGGIKFDDVRLAYTVGSVALGLILFDGGLRTRLATFRNVLAPAGLLATVGVLITATLTAPVASWMLGLTWSEALLVGAVMASTGALVTFGVAEWLHGSGFLAVYVAGLIVGNRETRAHNTIVTFLDAATWLAQIAMFVLLGLLAWPERFPQRLLPALAVALVLMLIARPAAVLICLAPFRFSLREKLFISWVGLRGAVSVFLAAIPMLVGLPGAHFYFDVAFVVVMLSLLIQGWTIGVAGRLLRVGLPRTDVNARRTELDLPGTLKQELVGYALVADSPYLRRGITPPWAKLTLVVRNDHVLTPEEAGTVREGDHVYFLAPPDRVQALDRFFAERSAQASPDEALVEDFFVPGDVTLGALAEIYGLTIPPEDAG